MTIRSSHFSASPPTQTPTRTRAFWLIVTCMLVCEDLVLIAVSCVLILHANCIYLCLLVYMWLPCLVLWPLKDSSLLFSIWMGLIFWEPWWSVYASPDESHDHTDLRYPVYSQFRPTNTHRHTEIRINYEAPWRLFWFIDSTSGRYKDFIMFIAVF